MNQPARDRESDAAAQMTQSFVVRIWIEEVVDPSNRVAWRGHITHVPDRSRRYFEDLSGVPIFVAPYLEGMGIRFSWYWRLMLWFWQRKVIPI